MNVPWLLEDYATGEDSVSIPFSPFSPFSPQIIQKTLISLLRCPSRKTLHTQSPLTPCTVEHAGFPRWLPATLLLPGHDPSVLLLASLYTRTAEAQGACAAL